MRRLNLDDTSRTMLIAFLHGLLPVLVKLGVVTMDADLVIMLQGTISVGITLLFRVFNFGQGGPVPETVMSVPADSAVSVTVDPPVAPPTP